MGRRRNWISTLTPILLLLAGAAAAEAQTITLASGKNYHEGDTGATANCPDISISCAGCYWNTTNGIRLVIPNSVNLTWDTSVNTPTYDKTNIQGGNVGATVTFPTSKVCLVPVTTNFTCGAPASLVIIKNLRFIVGSPLPTNSGSMGANYAGGNTALINDGNALTIFNNPTISSGGSYAVNPPGPVTANTITVTEANSSPGIRAGSGLRITIPSSLNMTWNTAVTNPTFGGSAAGRVSAGVTYANSNRTLNITVNTNFLANEQLTIANLGFTGIGTDSSGQLIATTNSNANPPSFPNDTNATDASVITVLGLPTLLSGANQAFTVGDPSTLAQPMTVTESAGTPKITAGNGIRITIPAGFNMIWDTSITAVTIGGTAQPTHISAAPAVTYANANRTVVIPVLSTFGSSQTAIISGLRFMNFTAGSPANNLQLDTTNDGIPEDLDNRSIAIGAPTISSGGNQVFSVGGGVTAANAITITDGTPARITSANAIRIKIPTGFTMEFDTTRVDVPSGLGFSGTGSAHASGTITYPGGSPHQTAIVNLGSDFTAGQTLIISGLRFQNFTGPSTPDNLQLEVNNLGTNCATDSFFVAVGGAATISSAANQAFTFNDPSTVAQTITITDANGFPSITTTNNIQIKIPALFPMVWNTTIAAPPVTFGGTGAGHVAGVNKVTYPDSKTAQINLASNFAAGETLIISGLQFQTFNGTAGPANLALKVAPAGNGVPDDKTIAVGRPGIALSASQNFGVGDPSTVLNTVGIAEDAVVPRITAANGILITIPATATLDMTWDTSIQTLAQGLSFTGTGAGHVSAGPTIVTYPTTKSALIALQSDFAAGETLFISGLKVKSFGSVTGPGALRLSVHPSGSVCSTTLNTLTIGARPQLLSVVTADTNGNGSLDHLILTFDKTINPATTSVTAGLGFSIVAPNYTIGAGSASGAVVTFTLVEKGTPDTGILPSVVYDPMVGNLQDMSGLTTNSTGPMVAKDGAAPVATGITKTDSNGNGHLDSVTITFSEALKTGQEDAGDWKLIDADGSTDLMQSVTSIVIAGSTVTFNLADTAGTAGTPVYLYTPNGNPLKIQDNAVPPNATVQQTNASAPNVLVNQDLAVGPSKVTLDASRSTDPNGQPLTFSWAFPGSINLIGANTATPYFLGTTPGAYTFTVTVSNLLVSKSVDVHVTILNVPPGADAGSDETVSPGDFLYVVALASNDANGDPLTFSWTQISGHPVALSGPTLPFPSFNAPVPSAVAPPDNILVFEVTVSDGVNTSKARATVRVNAAPNSLAPTANAGLDQVVSVGSTVQLDGSLSRDPEGAALTYKWTSTTPLNPLTGDVVNPTFVPALPGLYTFQLTVTDNTNLSSFPSTVHILVQDPANQAPVATAHRFEPVGEIVKGDQVVLDATGSMDPEGHALTYAWLQTAGPAVILENPSALRPTFTPVVAATYTFRLIVSDGVNQSNPDYVSMTVKDQPTDVTFTATLTGWTGVAPNNHAVLPGTFSLKIATSDPTDTWYFYLEQQAGPAVGIQTSYGGGQLTFPFANPTLTYQITPTVPGVYTFRLAATSNAGIRAYSTYTVTVDQPPTYQVPSALATGPLTAVAGQTITLDSTGSSATATRYYWSQLEGPPVALSNNRAAQTTVTPTAAGQYTFALTVADTTSNSAPSFVVVTVTPAASGVASSGGGSGGCGFLGLEVLLILPLFWAVSALRTRRAAVSSR